jgi:hypothetical protein
MKRRRRILILLLGLAALLFLLAGGVGAALLWPVPSDAERAAVKVEAGMTLPQAHVSAAANAPGLIPHSSMWGPDPREDGPEDYLCFYGDGSALVITFGPAGEGGRHVVSVAPSPPPSVHPLTCLRRTLARVLPFLRE